MNAWVAFGLLLLAVPGGAAWALAAYAKRQAAREQRAGRLRCRDRHDGALVVADFGEVTASGDFLCNVCLGRADYYPSNSEDLPENGICGRCKRELPVTALEGVTGPENRVCKTRCLPEIKREVIERARHGNA